MDEVAPAKLFTIIVTITDQKQRSENLGCGRARAEVMCLASPGVATSPASAIAVVKLSRSRYVEGDRADTDRAIAQHAVDE